MEDLAAGEAVGIFQIFGRDDLVRSGSARGRFGRVLRERLDDCFAQARRAVSPSRPFSLYGAYCM